MLKLVFRDHLSIFPSHAGSWSISLSSLDGGQCGWCKDIAENVGRALLGRRCGLFWIRGMSWVCARQPASGMCRRSTGRMANSSFSLPRTKAVEFRPCVTAATLRACALFGLHMIAEDAASSSFSGLSLGGMVGQGTLFGKATRCGWTESECTSDYEVYEHNLECRALELLGLGWSSEVVSVSSLWIGSLHELPWVANMALDLLCQEMKEACRGKLTVTVFRVYGRFSHLGTAMTVWRGVQ